MTDKKDNKLVTEISDLFEQWNKERIAETIEDKYKDDSKLYQFQIITFEEHMSQYKIFFEGMRDTNRRHYSVFEVMIAEEFKKMDELKEFMKNNYDKLNEVSDSEIGVCKISIKQRLFDSISKKFSEYSNTKKVLSLIIIKSIIEINKVNIAE